MESINYELEIVNNHCLPGAMSVNCFARLDQDVGQALPYLNSVLGGFEYFPDPVSLSLKVQGKLINITGNTIAVNALRDESEARKIVEWLIREIGEAWENRAEIEPCLTEAPKPKLIEILKFLPRSNCGKCGYPTCMVFASLAVEGAKGALDCPDMKKESTLRMDEYLGRFNLEN